jgi:hypothetical protein
MVGNGGNELSFLDDLAVAKETVSDRVVTPHIPVVINKKMYTVLVIRASSKDWAEATLRHGPREGIQADARNGYNMTGVTREIAPEYGRVVEDDGTETQLTAEQWDDFWEAMPPAAARLIEANVWFLHERDTELEIVEAKKASAPRRSSRKKSV